MVKNFRQEFEKDLANLINRHGMEKVFCDTPTLFWRKWLISQWSYLARVQKSEIDGTDSENYVKMQRKLNKITRTIVVSVKTASNALIV